MTFEELKTKTKDELVKTLLDLKKTQMEIRFKLAGGQLDKSHEVRANRRQIARVQTALNAPAETAKAKKAPAAKKTTTTKKADKAA